MYGFYQAPLMKSGISEEVWQLMKTDQEQFKQRVKAYFELGYPGWTVTSANYATRTIYLRDDRGSDKALFKREVQELTGK